MYNTFSILFFLQKNRVTPDGKAPIYCRITVNGKRAQTTIQRKVLLEKWDSSNGKVIGTSAESKAINKYIDDVRYKLNKIHERLLDINKPFTAMAIKNRYTGKDQVTKMLLVIFQAHNDEVNSLIGKDFAPGTAERYRTTKKHVQEYIQKEYMVDDIPIKNVDHKFITGLEYYLKTVRKCSHNTAIKYITNFKKIIRIAYANDWITKDPFLHWKAKLKTIDREFLSKEELQTVIDKEFEIPRLELVKDIFIFSCFTGLAYIDVKQLSKNDIVIGIDGEHWIKTKRAKTHTRSNIPLLPIPADIVRKYEEHPQVINTHKLLPILSNQKMNSYLKTIADSCAINKNLTYHLARHTFATTVTLTNGVPIESVSKMLGHKSLKTTQHYAKILDRKVSADMSVLKSILSKEEARVKEAKN
ncbi:MULTISPECIES: site-specific integrase [Bizionia]|uniref:Site-specific integrase n=1 Tax=Bizionia algoritergicola TaxID=291187 RepID=A0A5D0QW08_9FLAO|nr:MULTISPECIES: site-specific integrase [Bizionia]OBX23393.1 recombinase [Bizionia sp. APA-3]TYB73387.1 site-specific integrase [Bizionia algoritergicola]UPS91242.1 tyrosine-type recombinase/integrase [Bizionia sp. M204]